MTTPSEKDRETAPNTEMRLYRQEQEAREVLREFGIIGGTLSLAIRALQRGWEIREEALKRLHAAALAQARATCDCVGCPNHDKPMHEATLAQARADEREACAKVAENVYERESLVDAEWDVSTLVARIAAAIRARGENNQQEKP